MTSSAYNGSLSDSTLVLALQYLSKGRPFTCALCLILIASSSSANTKARGENGHPSLIPESTEK